MRTGNTDILSPAGEKRLIDIGEAYSYCEKVTRNHYENFPVASLLIPRAKRRHISAIYAFARGADDFADEGNLPADERIARLAEWNEHLEEAYAGAAKHPVFVALSRTALELDIPKEYFTSLLAAFRQDVVKRRYDDFDELLDYCRNSANPVGRLVLHVFGYRSRDLHRYSDFICTALQLANFWQDVETDLARNRIYLPQEDMERFDFDEGDLAAKRATIEYRRLMQLQVERTYALFRAGYPLVDRVGRDLRLELRMTWFGGVRILEKIEKLDYDVFGRRPKLHLLDGFSILLHAFSKRQPKLKRRTVYVS